MDPTTDSPITNVMGKAPRLKSALDSLNLANALLSDILGRFLERRKHRGGMPGIPEDFLEGLDDPPTRAEQLLRNVDELLGDNMRDLAHEIMRADQQSGMVDHLLETRIISRVWRSTNRVVDTLEDVLKLEEAETERDHVRELITVIDGAGNSPQQTAAEPAYQWKHP